SDRARLGFSGVGDLAEVMGHRVRLVGTVQTVKSLAAPYVFCSVETAYGLLDFVAPNQAVYLLAKCRNPADAPAVAERLRREYPDMSSYTRDEFSYRTRMHWL